jgi:hypothetical protein
MGDGSIPKHRSVVEKAPVPDLRTSREMMRPYGGERRSSGPQTRERVRSPAESRPRRRAFLNGSSYRATTLSPLYLATVMCVGYLLAIGNKLAKGGGIKEAGGGLSNRKDAP